MRQKEYQDLQVKFFSVLLSFILVLAGLIVLTPIDYTKAESAPEITLVFTGDLMLARSVGRKIDKHDDNYFPFHSIGEFTKKGDITFGNLENCVSGLGEPLDKTYTFRAKPGTLQGVKDAGFDVLTLANNHICDFGSEATLETMDYIEEYGMKHVGLWYLDEPASNATIPRPVVLEAKNVKFAFLGYGENLYGSFLATSDRAAPVPTDEAIMRADIQYAKSIADIVVVAIHWARLPQYVKEADSGQIELCHKLCDWGADILANHGPHVLQEVELYNKSLIFYSLGNTVFDLSNTDSQYSMIAVLHMTGSNFKTLELVPIIKNEHHQYIAQGDILKVNVEDGLYLDWEDYNSNMFNSDKLLSGYSGPDDDEDENLLTDRIIVFSIIILLSILVLIIIYWNRIKKCFAK